MDIRAKLDRARDHGGPLTPSKPPKPTEPDTAADPRYNPDLLHSPWSKGSSAAAPGTASSGGHSRSKRQAAATEAYLEAAEAKMAELVAEADAAKESGRAAEARAADAEARADAAETAARHSREHIADLEAHVTRLASLTAPALNETNETLLDLVRGDKVRMLAARWREYVRKRRAPGGKVTLAEAVEQAQLASRRLAEDLALRRRLGLPK